MLQCKKEKNIPVCIYSFILMSRLCQVDVWTRRICTGTEEICTGTEERGAGAAAERTASTICGSVNPPGFLVAQVAVRYFLVKQARVSSQSAHGRYNSASICWLFSVKWLQHLTMYSLGQTLWKGTISDKPVFQLRHSSRRSQSTVHVVAPFAVELDEQHFLVLLWGTFS